MESGKTKKPLSADKDRKPSAQFPAQHCYECLPRQGIVSGFTEPAVFGLTLILYHESIGLSILFSKKEKIYFEKNE
ncbi:MAG: hypothetical protein E7604_11905 [Ruminococcaceae bacterium]|nr:hypothetical protein [Oscillospiraceae bacterium]